MAPAPRCRPFPGFIMFALAFGTAAAQKGLSLGEALGLCAFVYAGASQMVGLEIWQKVWTPATILTIMTVTAIVNSRMILLGATLQPWLKHEPLARTALNLFLITEAGWIVSTRYHNEGGRDVGVLLGMRASLLWIGVGRRDASRASSPAPSCRSPGVSASIS